jgi:hypothetical protein
VDTTPTVVVDSAIVQRQRAAEIGYPSTIAGAVIADSAIVQRQCTAEIAYPSLELALLLLTVLLFNVNIPP